jgi:organic hydroperoxide reductase OsmC/OhrA
MPVPLPLHYQTWVARPLSGRLPEFDRDASGSSSPEHMLLRSIGLGLMTTFEAFAARDRIELVSCEARVGGTVDTTEGSLAFTKYRVELDVEVSDVDKARAALDDMKQHCLITNALRAPVEIDAKIRGASKRDAS